MPSPRASAATIRPIFPQPTTPSVLPSSSKPFRRSQPPALIAASEKGSDRARARIMPIASSATPRALAPSARRISMPRRRADSRSIASTPVPLRLMTRRSEAAESTSSVIGSTPASQPTQPGRSCFKSAAVGIFPAGGMTTSKPARASRSRAGWPSDVTDRGVTRIRGIYSMTSRPSRMNTRRGKPSIAMSP